MPGGWQTRQAAPSAIVADVRILHIAWEYPPLVFGGLGRHVGALARAQARAGNDVVVITRAEGPASLSTTDGVRIIRVPRDGPAEEVNTENLLPWVATAVHKHEKAKHKGQPLTKLAKGGKTNAQMKALGRNMAKIANQKSPSFKYKMGAK